MNFNTSYIPVQKNILFLFFISLLTIATVMTRTVNNEQNMQWFDDSARDTAVAELIVENGHYTDIRPGSGLIPALKNSTLYYNFLAGLYWLSGKKLPVFFDLYAVLTGICTVISIFLIGYVLYGFKLAIPASLTVLVHPLIIFINVSIYQRNLLASLTPLFVLFVLLAYKRRSLIYLWLATLVYWFLLASHYAAITLSPVLVWIHYAVLKTQDKRRSILLNIIFLIVSFTAFLSTINIKINELLLKDSAQSMQFSLLTPIFQVFDYFQTLFNWDLKYLTILLVPIVFLLLLVKKKNNLEKVFYWISATYFIFQIGVGICLPTHNLTYVYFYHYLALFLIMPYISMINVTTKLELKKFFDVSLVVLFLLFAVYLSQYSQPKVENKKNYFRTKNIADKIYAYDQRLNKSQNNYPVIIDNTTWAPPGWFASSINHHLVNKIAEYYLLRLNGNNLSYKIEEFDRFYLVCRMWTDSETSLSYSGDPDIIAKRCVEDLFTNHIMGVEQNNIDVTTVYREKRQSDDNFVVLFIDMDGHALSNDFLLDPWPELPNELN